MAGGMSRSSPGLASPNLCLGLSSPRLGELTSLWLELSSPNPSSDTTELRRHLGLALQTPSFLGLLVKKLLEILVLMTMSPTVAFSSAPLVTHLAASLALPETVERVVRRAASLPPMATSSDGTLTTQNLSVSDNKLNK